MTGRIVRSADFERVLGAVASARSEHFAVHYLSSEPSTPVLPARLRSKMELSTEHAPVMVASVDDFQGLPAGRKEPKLWLGLVIPKRHARRAVTRSLFKRQVRAAADHHSEALASGLWVVRLRAPFDNAKYPSAASSALQCAARQELDGLFASAARRAGGR
jgi:ribonuclease P protein component